MNGCTELERRINLLADEVVYLKKENEVLKEQIIDIKNKEVEPNLSKTLQGVLESDQKNELQEELKELKDDIYCVKVNTERELNRLESLIVDKLLINYKAETLTGNTARPAKQIDSQKRKDINEVGIQTNFESVRRGKVRKLSKWESQKFKDERKMNLWQQTSRLGAQK